MDEQLSGTMCKSVNNLFKLPKPDKMGKLEGGDSSLELLLLTLPLCFYLIKNNRGACDHF